MVQEFQVLRCFSCQTFQVQQVKKAKKWTCKVCGEKQSLIKEFGRGAAADCRQHVQKLNAMRGEQLQVNTQQLLTQWDEDEKDKNEDLHEALDPKLEQEMTHVSRWSKYTDQTAEDQNEEEDENVYTERHQFRIQGPRKRKKMSKAFGGDHDRYEEEESQSGYSGFKRQSYLPLEHKKRFSSSWNKGSASKYSSLDQPDDVNPCTRTKVPSSRQAVCHYPKACSSSTYTVESSGGNKQPYNSSYKPSTTDLNKRLAIHSESASIASPQKLSESTIEKKDSKWNKFLTIIPTQDKEEYDYKAHDSSHNDENTKTHYFTKADTGVDSECRYPVDGKEDSVARSRQHAVGGNCVDGNVSRSTTSYTSRSAGFENDVSKQPLLANAACSILSLNSLFCTDEDFDDTF